MGLQSPEPTTLSPSGSFFSGSGKLVIVLLPLVVHVYSIIPLTL